MPQQRDVAAQERSSGRKDAEERLRWGWAHDAAAVRTQALLGDSHRDAIFDLFFSPTQAVRRVLRRCLAQLLALPGPVLFWTLSVT